MNIIGILFIGMWTLGGVLYWAIMMDEGCKGWPQRIVLAAISGPLAWVFFLAFVATGRS